MSKLKVSGNASGTGVITLEAPNTNTDRTITLPDGDISLGVGIDDNATSTAITIDANENVGIGITSPSGLLNIQGTTDHLKLTYPSIASYILDVKSNGDFAIDKDGTERLRIQSGGGITFNGDTAAANALDDYEEGTWTPGITFGGTFDGTYDVQVGNYTKIGDLVTVSCFVDLGTKGTTTGAALLTGLPFTTNTTALTYSAPSFYINTVSFADMIVGFAPNNGTTVIIREVTNAGSASNLDNTNFTNTSHVMMNLSYRV